MTDTQDTCTSSKSGRHFFSNIVMTKADFEPVEYGASAEDTRYKRVEYVILACNCAAAKKSRVDVSGVN
jgi:hypothetical protein